MEGKGGGHPLTPQIKPRETNPEQSPRCSRPTLRMDSVMCHERFETKTSSFVVIGSGRCSGGSARLGCRCLAEAFQCNRVRKFYGFWCFSATGVLDHVSDLGGNFRRSSTSRRDGANSAKFIKFSHRCQCLDGVDTLRSQK